MRSVELWAQEMSCNRPDAWTIIVIINHVKWIVNWILLKWIQSYASDHCALPKDKCSRKQFGRFCPARKKIENHKSNSVVNCGFVITNLYFFMKARGHGMEWNDAKNVVARVAWAELSACVRYCLLEPPTTTYAFVWQQYITRTTTTSISLYYVSEAVMLLISSFMCKNVLQKNTTR